MNFLNDITVNNNITAVGTIQSANLTLTGLSTGSYTSILVENAGIVYKRDLSLSLLPAGTEGQMLYNNGGTWTAFSGVFWDDTNSRLGVGLTSGLAAKLHVRGPGTTSGTYSFIAEKSDGSDVLAVRDDGEVDITGILNVNSNGTAKMTVDSSTGLNRRVIIGATTGVDDTFIVRADDNTVTPSAARFQNLDSTSVANGIRLRFEMATTAAATVNAGAIDIIKNAVWTSTASTQDSHMRFLLSVDGTLTEAMRINSGLNVGIGTANPVSSGADGRVVHLVSPTRTEFRAATTSSATMRAGATNVGYIGTEGAHDFLLQTNLVTRATINATTGVFNFTATPTVSGSTMWHAGNDGASSTLDADLLDGQHGSYYLDSTGLTLPTTWSVGIQETGAKPFLYGTYGDAAAFRTISNLQYWDGSAWQTYVNTGIQAILTGNIQQTSATVTAANRQFRFQFTAPGQYLGNGVLVVHQTWNQGGAHQVSSMLEYWNGSAWVTLIANATSPSGENNYHFYNRGAINGAWDLYRVTITGADTVNSASYTGIQLLYDYTRSTLANNFLPITWDSSRNVTTTGNCTGNRFVSTVATGTAPLSVTSTTLVTNLNAERLNSQLASYYENRDTTAVSFSSGTLTLTRAAGNLTVSLDGRYVPLSGGTMTDKLIVSNAQPGVVLVETDTVNKNRWIDIENGTFRILKVNDALNSWTNQLLINEDGKATFTGAITTTITNHDAAIRISASINTTESYHKMGLWNEVSISGAQTYQRTGIWTTVNATTANTFSSLVGHVAYISSGHASAVVSDAIGFFVTNPGVTGTITVFNAFEVSDLSSTQINTAYGLYSNMSTVGGKTRYFLYGNGTAPSYLAGLLTLNASLNANAGTAGAPSLSFTSDPDTGIFSAGANQLGLTAGGTQCARLLTTGLEVYNSTGPQLRLSGQATNTGGVYLACVDEGDPSNEGYLAFGAEGTHASGAVSTWTAKVSSAGIIHCDNGTFTFFSDTSGLTAGNTFTPTSAMSVAASGVSVANALTVGGAAALNGGANITNADPRLYFYESDGAAEQKRNDLMNQGSVFYGRFYNDAGSLSHNWLSVTRNASTYTAGTITLNASTIAITGAMTISSSTLVSNLNADQLDGQHGSYYLDTSSGTQSKSGNLTLSGTVTMSGRTSITGELTNPSNCGRVHSGNVEKYYQCSQKLQGTTYTGNSTTMEIEVVTTVGGSYGGPMSRTVWRICTRGSVSVLRFDEHGGVNNCTLRIIDDTTVADTAATKFFVGVTMGNAATYNMGYIRARYLETDAGSRWMTIAEMATATPTTQGGSALTYSSGWVVNSGSYTLLSHTETIMNLKAGQLTSTVSTGTAPFVVASTTLVSNLNAERLNSQLASYYLDTSSTGQTKTGQLTFNNDADGVVYITASTANSGCLVYGNVSGTGKVRLQKDGSVRCLSLDVRTGTDVNSGGTVASISNAGAVTAASFSGPLTGNVTGNCTGSSGSCTGNSASATYASNITITNDTTTNATMYPVWVTANTGNLPLKVTSTKLGYNPSTGTLSLTGAISVSGGNVSVSGAQVSVAGGGSGLLIGRRDTSAAAWQWYSSAGSLELYDHVGAANRLTWTTGGVLTISAASATFTGASGMTVNGGPTTLKAAAMGTTATYFAVFTGDPSTSGQAINTRTASQVLSDIGAASSGHNHAGVYATTGAVTTSGLTMSTARLLGRTTAATGAIEEITVSTGLTFSAATLSVAYGSTASTACVGNDSRLSDARTPLSHVHGNITNAGAIGSTSGLPIITTTSGVLTTGSFGSAAGTFCQGNDSRLSDARTPLSHTHGNITNAGAIGVTSGLPIITTTSGVLTTGSFGTTAGTFCQGNDSRLSDARTPLSHTHAYTDVNNITTGRLLGRTTAATGACELISLANGTNCAATLTATTLTIAISSTPTFTDCTVTGRLNLPTSQPGSPVNGSCYWDGATNKFWVYSSTYGWKSVTLT